MSVSKILVATDFSKTARLAVQRAIELAKAHGAEIVIAHSVNVQRYSVGGPDLVALPQNIDEMMREAAEESLKEIADEVASSGARVATEVLSGTAANSITRAAEQLGADLIVVGTRGNTGFAHVLLGSTAEAIVRHSPCPVLTIHPADSASLEAVRLVVVPTDFSDDASLCIDRIGEIFDGVASSLKVVLAHAYHVPVAMAPFATMYPAAIIIPGDARGAAEQALEPIAAALRDRGFEVEVVVREGDSATVVTELAAEVGAQLIALGTRGFAKVKQIVMGSTAERVVQHAHCPVLTVKRPES